MSSIREQLLHTLANRTITLIHDEGRMTLRQRWPSDRWGQKSGQGRISDPPTEVRCKCEGADRVSDITTCNCETFSIADAITVDLVRFNCIMRIEVSQNRYP